MRNSVLVVACCTPIIIDFTLAILRSNYKMVGLSPLPMSLNKIVLSTVGHEALANEVRQSPYFQQLPALSISCRDLDGDPNTLPIIFEDVFLSPNSSHSKRVPWCHQPDVSIKTNGTVSADRPEFLVLSNVPLARGDSQVNDKLQMKPRPDDINPTRVDVQSSAEINVEGKPEAVNNLPITEKLTNKFVISDS